MPTVISQLSNNNVRVKEETHRALVELSQEPSAGCAYVAQYVTRPPKQAKNHKEVIYALRPVIPTRATGGAQARLASRWVVSVGE